MSQEDEGIDEQNSTESHADEPKSASKTVSEAVMKALAQGFRSVRSGEEKLRGFVSDTMPKEVVAYMKGAIDSGRDELVRIVGTQTRKFIEGIDVGHELAKILTSISFEIRTEVRFIPNDQKIKPDIKMSVKPKRSSKAVKDAPAED